MKYKEYIKEIEDIKDKLSASQILMLQLVAAFECGEFNYNKLKKEFLNGSNNLC